MEVIKHGKSYRVVICPECECEFRFNKKEIHTKYLTDDAFGCYGEYDYIDCPECTKRIILNERVIEI